MGITHLQQSLNSPFSNDLEDKVIHPTLAEDIGLDLRIASVNYFQQILHISRSSLLRIYADQIIYLD